jgi:hypothetical protein
MAAMSKWEALDHATSFAFLALEIFMDIYEWYTGEPYGLLEG